MSLEETDGAADAAAEGNGEMANEEKREAAMENMEKAAEAEAGGRTVARMRIDGEGVHMDAGGEGRGLPWKGMRIFLSGAHIGRGTGEAEAEPARAMYHGIADVLMDGGAAEVVCPCDIVPRDADPRAALRIRLDALLDARTDCLMAVPEPEEGDRSPADAADMPELERRVAFACGLTVYTMARTAGGGADR